MDYGTMVKGIASGMPLLGVFAVHQRSPMIIISDPDAPIEAPAELEGKILAMSQSESTAQMLPVLAAMNELDLSNVNVISPAVGAKMALFLQGRADAITGVTYFHLPPLEAQGMEPYYFSYADFGVTALEGGIVANRTWLEENPELAQSFVAATQETFLKAKDDPGAAVDALIAQRPDQAGNREILIRQLELSMEATSTPNTADLPFGAMSEVDWQAMIDQFVESGQLAESLPLDKLYSNDYVPQ